MNKFEQLIEYVINDDEAKARELFHDIVVEKSRAIYEEMMAADEELEEAADEELEEVEMEEGMDPNMEGMGGDMAEDLIDAIETEESGVNMDEDDHDMDEPEHDGLEPFPAFAVGKTLAERAAVARDEGLAELVTCDGVYEGGGQ